MVTRKIHRVESGTSKTAIATKAKSTTSDNSKHKRPQIPATDPKQIQNLWYQVRNQTRAKMSSQQSPEYMVHTNSTEAKRKTRRTATPTTLSAPSVTSTALTSHSHSISIKSPLFREKCLMPRGIFIKDEGVLPPDPFSHFFHFQTTKLSGIRWAEGIYVMAEYGSCIH